MISGPRVPGGSVVNPTPRRSRRVLRRVLRVLVSLVVAIPAAVTGNLVELRLPGPAGPFPVGTTTLHLVDHDRVDPWRPSVGARELMVTLWYPILPGDRRAIDPWLPPRAADHFLARVSGRGAPPPDLPRVPDTHSHRDAPMAARSGGWPLVLFSPGYGEVRALGTSLTEDLASRGFVVAGIDHTFDATEVEFPGNRLVLRHQPDPNPEVLADSARIRAEDVRFVLDELTELNRGRSPDAERRVPPVGSTSSLDLTRIGIFGHSLGGATAAEAMLEDRRISAGVDLDGVLYGAVLDRGLDRPFLLVSRQGHSHHTDPSWARLWPRLTGWRAEVQLAGSAHYSFTDNETLLPQMAGPLGLTPQQLSELVGTIDPRVAVDTERAYLAAFFTRTLRGEDDGLLCRPSPRFPHASLVG